MVDFVAQLLVNLAAHGSFGGFVTVYHAGGDFQNFGFGADAELAGEDVHLPGGVVDQRGHGLAGRKLLALELGVAVLNDKLVDFVMTVEYLGSLDNLHVRITVLYLC